MKKKIPLSIVITIALVAAAIAFSLAYVIATASMNAKLTDLGQKQALFSTLSDVDSFVREKSFHNMDQEKLTRELCRGYAQASEGRLLYLTAEEYKDSGYTADKGYTVLTLADSSALVVLSEEQYEAMRGTEPLEETTSASSAE
ncbi:MAG: hypothetical protein IJA62_07590 [Ruminococcus sp.]|nr:hypothetical protein [Ruminococcus sp.]